MIPGGDHVSVAALEVSDRIRSTNSTMVLSVDGWRQHRRPSDFIRLLIFFRNPIVRRPRTKHTLDPDRFSSQFRESPI